MKVLKRVCSFALALGMIITPCNVAKAVDGTETTATAESAKQGVVQVNTVYVDDNSEKHLVVGGAGFIVGDAEGTEYVITCNHIVNPDKEVKQSALDFYNSEDAAGAKSAGDIEFSTEVVVEGDFVLAATVVTASSDLDMAVLQLPQPIYTRTPLKFFTNKNHDVNALPYAEGDTVYALGYPEGIDCTSATKYYSDQQVQMAEGTITKLVENEGIQLVESTAVTGMNNYGGPLVNKDGYVIGLSLPLHDGEASCALDSTKITKVLEGFGVDFAMVDEAPQDEQKIKLNTPSVEESDEEEAEVETTVAIPDQKKKGISETVIIVVSLLAVFLIVCGVAGTILFAVNKDKSSSKKAKKTYNGPVFDFDVAPESDVKFTGANSASISAMNVQQPVQPKQPKKPSIMKKPTAMPQSTVPAGSAETTILSAIPKDNSGDTSVLSEEADAPQNLGTLTRKKTSEKIFVNKSDFVLGKDASHADFCIDNNSSISRTHAMITSGRNGVYIQDCHSTNGTFINGTKIESGRLVLLNDGDIVKLSNEEFEYHS